MAKICLEDTENNGMRITVEGTGGELISLLSNAFLSEDYLRVAAVKGLADCLSLEWARGKNAETN